jgi:hypothetical protein
MVTLAFIAGLVAVAFAAKQSLTPFQQRCSSVTASELDALENAVVRKQAPVRPSVPIIRPGFTGSAQLVAQPSAIQEFEDVFIKWCVRVRGPSCCVWLDILGNAGTAWQVWHQE